MKKIILSSITLLIIVISILGITYSKEITTSLKFDLIGPNPLELEVYNEYIEYGIKITNNNQDITDNVIVDKSNLNTSIIGTYKIKYMVVIDDIEEYIYREVNIIDSEPPVIKLNGQALEIIPLNSIYKDSGVIVTDNYDTDIQNKVIITNNINTNKEGAYTIKYEVTDQSGNTTTTSRKVIVKK